MSENETPLRANAATILSYAHQEAMARATQPRTAPESYEIARKSPAGKTAGFEFTIVHPDPETAAALAEEWDQRFPAPQPIVKP